LATPGGRTLVRVLGVVAGVTPRGGVVVVGVVVAVVPSVALVLGVLIVPPMREVIRMTMPCGRKLPQMTYLIK